jgi:hypothetical protein
MDLKGNNPGSSLYLNGKLKAAGALVPDYLLQRMIRIPRGMRGW